MHHAVKLSMDNVQSCWASPIRHRNKRTKEVMIAWIDQKSFPLEHQIYLLQYVSVPEF